MNDKLLTGVTAVLFVLGIGCILYVVIDNFSLEINMSHEGNLDCISRTQTIANSEESMAGVVALEGRFKALHNYYSCNKVQHNDLVLYQFSSSIPPVVRVAHGLPGDKFEVTKDESTEGTWTIKINGQQVEGSAGPYIITNKNVPPLKTYEISRKGVLGENEYIVFADKSPSISDSSNLGIIKRAALIGRAFKFEDAPGS